MSDIEKRNTSPNIKVLENVLIKQSSEDSSESVCIIEPDPKDSVISSSNNDHIAGGDSIEENLDTTVELEISKIVQHSDPLSPTATAVSTKDPIQLSDDDTPKVILNLGVSAPPMPTENSGEEGIVDVEGLLEASEVNKAALEQLDLLAQQKKGSRMKIVQKDPLHIEKADQNGKPHVKLHNRILANSSNSKDLEKELLSQITISSEKPKKILNSLATTATTAATTTTNNDDLVAILEGHDIGDTDEVHYEVVQIIQDSDEKSDEPTVILTKQELSKEEEKKIALEQISNIPKANRGRKRKIMVNDDATAAAPTKVASASDLVTSLASEWSDGEKELDIKNAEKPAQEKKSTTGKKNEKQQISVSEIKVEPFRRTRVIKKKIIWDPDAPETQFSYASLVQSSAKKSTQQQQPQQQQQQQQQKKPRATSISTPPVTKRSETPIIKTPTPAPTQKGKRRSETPTVLNNKKKKPSEIDKLLGDEGAANMLSSLGNEKTTEKETRATKKDTSAAHSTVVEKQSAAVAAATAAKKEPPSKRRVTKAKASAAWDYVYNQQNEDSLIIRRRSNSSYSSTSPRRLSLEQTPSAAQTRKSGATKISPTGIGGKLSAIRTKTPPGTKMVAVSLAKGKHFEFAKPEAKRNTRKENEVVTSTTSTEDVKRESLRKSTRTPLPVHVENNDNQVKTQTDKVKDVVVVVKKHDDVTELQLTPKVDKVKNSFTVQLMNEVTKRLNELKVDGGCKVVMITTSGQNFCQGVDFAPLIAGTADKKKASAVELAASVKNFLHAIASFPKPIIAGVTGTLSGLGVTMLPLFDVVVSSDKSTFETNYAKIGQIPEGHCILSLMNNVRHNFKIKLLVLCERINSTEAALSGLVTKITSPVKVQEDTIQCAKRIASFSQQSYTSMKAQRHKLELSKLIAALNEEQKILSQQWITSECQEKFKQFLQKDCW